MQPQSSSATTNISIYDHSAIEKKWLTFWEKEQLFQHANTKTKDGRGTLDLSKIDPLYLLFAFAYPSGSGLHVGHVESKTALDILARFYRMNGKDVFFPVGWDAFGLPVENYAIKTGIPPAVTTKNAIDTFRSQIKRIGISYDWANEIATSHPGYYRWTQWLFLELYKVGLAYKKAGMVNWCPSCQTVLANEQVVAGHCERCDSEVVQKQMDQWYFKITDYQEELISGLDSVDWPAATKQQQLNWIGKKAGITINYKIEGTDQQIACFTTRPDTNFGATFIVVAPEHPFIAEIITGKVGQGIVTDQHRQDLAQYLTAASKKTELERQKEGKTKTGAFTGLYAINALNNTKLPIWVSDFVLAGFGTGAVVGVPGHDNRDFEFAQTFSIPIIRVVVAPDGDSSEITQLAQVQEDAGVMINSQFLDGLQIQVAKEKMTDYLEEKGWGERVITYRLRDWLISRQRYWGVPIPILYDPDGNPHAINTEQLPWKLAEDVDFKPTGESPLHSSVELQQRTESYAAAHFAELIAANGWDKSGKGWRPEYDTMDTFVDSSWYYLRYLDSRNTEVFADQAQLKAWLPVDFYMIGPEHIVLHLLYSRFFTKFLRDQKLITIDEPFMKMRHQGMILGPDNRKMSKSKGNVINPDEVIEKFGADTLRMYEMFMGPIESDKPWDISAVAGVYRFILRVYDLVKETALQQVVGAPDSSLQNRSEKASELRSKLHVTIRKVSDDIPKLKFNTAIASMMELVNLWEKQLRHQSVTLDRAEVVAFIKILAPFAPFVADELYSQLKSGDDQAASVHLAAWPTYDDSLIQQQQITIPVQVNGKVREQLTLDSEVTDKDTVIALAQQLPKLSKYLAGATPKTVVYVPGKIINFVV